MTEHNIKDYLQTLRTIANKAYWKNETDCGADMDAECVSCKHYDVCLANNHLNTLEDRM